MPERKQDRQRPTRTLPRRSERREATAGFTEEERAAMRERVEELKAARRGAAKEEEEQAVLAKISTMPPSDRAMARRFHALVRAEAPALGSRLWYGMPAYTKDGHVLCFFRDAAKFKTRYATLGFSDEANLDDGAMWPTDFALTELGPAEEARIAELLKRALR